MRRCAALGTHRPADINRPANDFIPGRCHKGGVRSYSTVTRLRQIPRLVYFCPLQHHHLVSQYLHRPIDQPDRIVRHQVAFPRSGTS